MDFKFEIHAPVPSDLWEKVSHVGSVTFGKQTIPIVTHDYDTDQRVLSGLIVTAWTFTPDGDPYAPVIVTTSGGFRFLKENHIVGPIVAHEVGHWVHGDVKAVMEGAPARSLSVEIAADRYAAAIFGHGEMIHALRVISSLCNEEGRMEIEHRIAALSV